MTTDWYRVSRRSFLQGAGAVVAGAAGMALVGCGDDDASGNAAPLPSTTAGAGSPTNKALNRSAIVRLNGSNFDSFDAVTGTGGDGQQFLWTVFDNLVAYDSKLRVSQDRSLALSFEQSDPLTIAFHLRNGVTFHDGTSFNADAVKINFAHALAEGSRSGALADLSAVDSVQTPDSTTAIFKMKRPDGGLLVKLGDRPGFQSSPSAMDKYGASFKNGSYKRNPVGTGAFKFDKWQEGSFIRVVKNPNYWQADRPLIAGIEWKVIPDPNTAFAAFRTGDLEVLWALDSKNIKTAADSPGAVVRQQPGVSIPSFMLNTARPPFNNPHAGRAVSFAIDRDPIIKLILNGTARPAATWFAPGNAEYDPNYKGLWYDPDKARAELAMAGLTDGFEWLVVGGVNPSELEFLQVIQSQLAKFKISMKIQQSADFVARFRDSHIGDAFYSSYSGRAEPSQSFNFKDAKSGVYASSGAKTWDPSFEAMLVDLEGTFAFDERKKKLYGLADFVNDQGWDVFLWHPETIVTHSNKVAFDVFGDGKPHFGQGDISVSA